MINSFEKLEQNTNFTASNTWYERPGNDPLITDLSMSVSYVFMCWIDNAHNNLMSKKGLIGVKIAAIIGLNIATLTVTVFAIAESVLRLALAILSSPTLCVSGTDSMSAFALRSAFITFYQVLGSINTHVNITLGSQNAVNLTSQLNSPEEDEGIEGRAPTDSSQDSDPISEEEIALLIASIESVGG